MKSIFTLLSNHSKAISMFLIMLFSFIYCQAQITLNVTVTTTPSCAHNGTAAVTVSNGNSPYSYIWYGPNGSQFFTQSISGLPGCYLYVQVTDATGNFGYATAFISPPFNITHSETPDSCNTGIGTCAIVVTGGSAPYTYLWSNGETSSTATGLQSGPMDCTVTDANGCYMLLSDLDSLNGQGGVVIPSLSPITIAVSSTPANCIDGTATATPTNGTAPYTFSWNTTPVQTTQTATGLHSGTVYYVTVTDVTGCTQSNYAYCTSTSNLSVSSNTVPENCQYNNGSATAIATNGFAPFSYLWSNGATTSVISGLSSGAYYVTITDAHGCHVQGYTNVGHISPVVLTPTYVPSSCTVNNGSISIVASGGLPPYNYFWQTVPVQTTATATGLGAGHYVVIVTDANLCTTDNTLQLTDNSTLALNVTATNDICSQGLGTGLANASLGTPPYSYNWLTTPVQNTATATGLTQGWWGVSITDNVGCVRTGKAYVYNTSPVSIYGGAYNASCIYTADGSIIPLVTGGTTPYTYSWSNGTTNATATNLLTGWYELVVTDATGCSAYKCFFVDYNSTLPCAVVISGKVYNDINSNCIQDLGEYPIANVAVQCIPSGGTHFTDNNGDYSFVLPPGTYTVSHTEPQYFTQACPAGNYTLSLLVAGTDSLNNDFADAGFVNDLSLDCYNYTQPVQGFNYHQVVSYVNKGSALTTGTITVKHDPLLSFQYSFPMPSNYNGTTQTATWNVNNLYPDLYTNLDIHYNIPASVLLGTHINFQDTIVPLIGDTFVYDNYLWYLETVVGPYDPNFMEVRPSGTGPQGFIAANDSAMEYVVHFQNTGTFTAQRVLVRIPLDSHLDALTLQPGASSHAYTAEISPANELIFTFDNINLPDSNFDEAASHGFVSYKVKQVSNLLPGTLINGQANIYFDFSSPVATNMVLNTIVTGISDIENNFNIQLQPNPFSDAVTLSYHLENATNVSVEIFDVTGKSVFQSVPELKLTGDHSLSLTKEMIVFNAGVYFVKLTCGNSSTVKKLIRMKM